MSQISEKNIYPLNKCPNNRNTFQIGSCLSCWNPWILFVWWNSNLITYKSWSFYAEFFIIISTCLFQCDFCSGAFISMEFLLNSFLNYSVYFTSQVSKKLVPSPITWLCSSRGKWSSPGCSGVKLHILQFECLKETSSVKGVVKSPVMLKPWPP